jgi:hypothetical protein
VRAGLTPSSGSRYEARLHPRGSLAGDLPQPHGFEGLRSIREHLELDAPGVKDAPNVHYVLGDLHAARPTAPRPAHRDNDVIAADDELARFNVQILEHLLEFREPPVEYLAAYKLATTWQLRPSAVSEVRVQELDESSVVPPTESVVSGLEPAKTLSRHRPPSISPRRKPREGFLNKPSKQ